MLHKMFFLCVGLSLIASLLGSSVPHAVAKGDQPPVPPFEKHKPLLPGEHLGRPDRPLERHSDPNQPGALAPQATGGPDDYGYTWDDTGAFGWLDARAGGSYSNLTGDDEYQGPLDIGFSFPFYENAYSQLFFSTNGLVTFGSGSWSYGNTFIPNPGPPNNFIAPFWDDLVVNFGGYNTGAIYTMQGGTFPNRYFVIEWYQVSQLGYYDLLTFEAVLFENGNITLQYLDLNGNLYPTLGIEDSDGIVGLLYPYSSLHNNLALRFFRPTTPMARLKLNPLYSGSLAGPQSTIDFPLTIRNTGNFGTDTYKLQISSAWPVALYKANGSSLLSDTDGDGKIDSGPVAQGASLSFLARMSKPPITNVADANTAAITATSSLNAAKSKTATLRGAVAAPFAQVYSDRADGAMSLYLATPAAQALAKATPDGYHGFDVAVTEAPNGNFIYAWAKGGCIDSTCNIVYSDIEYTLLNNTGGTVLPVGKLTNNSAATVTTEDYAPAVAVAPNGAIGVLWYHYLWDINTQKFNYNIFFAILDSSGNLAVGPLNLTNNGLWGTWNDYGVPGFYNPRIAATGDNRFVLSWEQDSYESNGWLEDIFYAVRGTSGAELNPVTKLTAGVAGNTYFYYPVLTSLNGNRVLLAYRKSPGSISYTILDSAGSLVKAETSTGSFGGAPNAAQLSDGRIALAWTWPLSFAILDGSTYNLLSGPTTLSNPAAFTGDAYISVAADQNGRAILTWMDDNYSYRRHLYYALVSSSGSVLTQPMIFRDAAQSQSGDYTIETSFEGYGNTSFTQPASTPNVDAFLATGNAGAPPNGRASISLVFGNNGATTASSVTISAILDSNLTYVGDSSGITPSQVGNTLTWSLPNLAFMGKGQFTLWVSVPSAPVGTQYPVALQISSAGPDPNPTNNSANTQVMVSKQLFLPTIAFVK